MYSKATLDVLTERLGQSVQYSQKHDDAHNNGVLSIAAAAYIMQSEPLYPWSNRPALKAPFRIRLVRAAALLIAEIERLDREESRKTVELPRAG